MSKANTNNYDTKSSILSIDFKDYKLPYDISQSSRIVQHLEQSQEELEFLKIKLTEAYEKLQRQIKNNMQTSELYQQAMMQVKLFKSNWEIEQKENKKLKQVMDTMLKNRKMLEEQVEYVHKKYKKIIQQKNQEHQRQIQQLQKQCKKLKKQNTALQEQLKNKSRRDSLSISKANSEYEKLMQSKIQILQNQIKKLTNEKVTEVSRLKHQIQCYKQRSVSPIRQTYNDSMTQRHPRIQYYDAIQNNQNINTNNMVQSSISNSNIVQSKITVESMKTDDDSISKWQKSSKTSANIEISDDQKLTKAQMERKRVQNQLMKIERLKRHTPQDRQAMTTLEKRIYELDSQISSLKRKIRQKY